MAETWKPDIWILVLVQIACVQAWSSIWQETCLDQMVSKVLSNSRIPELHGNFDQLNNESLEIGQESITPLIPNFH